MTEIIDRLWQRARRYMAANQAAPARAALESILVRNPDDTAAHLVLGGLYAADDHQRAATRQVLEAARNPPDDAGLLGDLVAALLKVGEIVEARRLLGLPAINEADSVHVLMRAASQWQLMGDHAAALHVVEKARRAGAVGREFHFYRAVQLAFNGQLGESRVELDRCIAIDPPLGRAYVQLARMQTQSATDNHLPAIESALQRVHTGSEDHAALEFARYKELEDLERHAEAWEALAHGNALMYARLTYGAAQEAVRFDRLIDACTPGFLRPEVTAAEGPQPIFVIGMPRSGTTVLERLLGNHSQVVSAGELGDFPRALAYAADHLPRVMFDETTIERLSNIDWAEVGRTYLAQTRWRAHGKSFFVDKLPRNWMLAGFIHKALPNAKILHLVREPMDVCFSNWRAYFGPGPEFAYAYQLDALADHYGHYRRVMEHWHATMPRVILDLPYARLVREPETVAREVLEFCGLDWESGCVDLTRNPSPSATLSMSQVRRPIHTRSFDEWQPYAKQLAIFQSALGG